MNTSIGLSEAISRQGWIEPGEEALQKAVHQAFESTGEAGQHIKDALHGTWLGHPLHVVLTDIPLGAWTTAMLLDGISTISKSASMDSAADTCIAVGLGGAIAAALTGVTDWQDLDPPARRIGLVHGVMNLTAAALMGTSFFMRRSQMRTGGRCLGLIGFMTAAAAALLGGSLVYDHRVGVDRSAEGGLPSDFHRAASTADLEEGKPLRAEVEGTPIVLVKSGNDVFALVNACSHLGGPLSEGKIEEGTIQCPWHGSRFNLKDGCVLNGPAVHPQRCLEVRISNGQVEVRQLTS